MAAQFPADKVTTMRLVRMKNRGEKIVCLTAYDFPFARIIDEAGVDIVLIGDSAANVIYGMPTTLSIGMEEMLYHTRAVANGVRRALIVSDMPFLSYQISIERAIENAGRLLKAGAEAVKLEGAGPVVTTVRTLVEYGIPVMGHLGLTPQAVHKLGGYRLQARTPDEQNKLLQDALELEQAGCFALVLEKIPAELAKQVTMRLRIPTIGIGAGPDCDGQVLVLQDLLGFFEAPKFKFVKRYAEIGRDVRRAVENFITDVRSGIFPGKEHSFYSDEGSQKS
jgi:3-methyl-2-oxobutanoate hydroxymethyltransferase